MQEIREVLRKATKKLRKISKRPSLDIEILLAHVLKISKAKLFAYPEKKITKKQHSKFKKLVIRRLQHEPIAYITKNKEFYGLRFYVDKNVLIPRPETELLVESALELVKQLTRKDKRLTIADIGTGSGCIAITLAKYTERVRIYALEISDSVLKIAKRNAKKHKVLSKITFLKGNLFEPLKNRKLDIIIANLPYLTTKQWMTLMPDIRKYEPRQALDGGKDGLDYIKKLLSQITETKFPPKAIILEIGGKKEINKIKKLAKSLWPKSQIKVKKDLRKLDRVIIISEIS